MKCDNCQKAATVHLTQLQGQTKSQRHLCAECAAAAAGMASNEDAPVNELLRKFVLEHIKDKPKQPPKSGD